jgi:nucleotide-binding universal stress UspA family protein
MTIPKSAILVGVDGSATDDIAIEWGAQEASMRALPLHIVHVVDSSAPLPQMISQDLADLPRTRSGWMAVEIVEQATENARTAAPGIKVNQAVLPGRVVEQLVKAAADARILVLGSGQRFDPSRIGLGSVATHVATHAPCPVIVARTPAEGEPTTGPSAGRVVVGIDGSAASETAVDFAFDEASRRGCGLTAVHAYSRLPDAGSIDSGDSAERDRAAARVLAEALAGCTEKYSDVDVVSRLVPRLPVSALVGESAGAILLVVGSHGHGWFAGMLLGSVSQAVLRHASVSVAVARPVPHAVDRDGVH